MTTQKITDFTLTELQQKFALLNLQNKKLHSDVETTPH